MPCNTALPPRSRALPHAPLPPCIYNNPAAMISLFPTGRTRPELGLIRDICPRALPPRRDTLSPLTDTHSFRHSRALGAPLLFGPTRKRPRQATPPPRHRQQQRHTRNWETESRSARAPRPSVAEARTELTEQHTKVAEVSSRVYEIVRRLSKKNEVCSVRILKKDQLCSNV